METLTFLEMAKRIMEEEKRPLSPDEIWKIATSKGYDTLLRSVGKTPWATVAAQLYVNVRDKKATPFVRVGTRPSRFYLRALLSVAELQQLQQSAQEENQKEEREPEYQERDLHPFLAYYTSLYLRAYTKTIQHTKSEKKEYGEWIHPDMVGCYFPLDDWKPEVMELGSIIGNPAIKLFSFEIKKNLGFRNLRESFFQTVSNSSWAHEGYLVAAEVSTDEDFQTELKRLSNSFGIGVIRLSLDDPDSSQIVFPARTRENLDWDAMNKLTVNPDFREFLKRVKNDMANKEIIEEKYDKVLEREDLIKSIKRRHPTKR
jgi:hypothetical protein